MNTVRQSAFSSPWVIMLITLSLGLLGINRGGLWKDEKISLLCATGLFELKKDQHVFSQHDYWQRNTLANAIAATKQLNGGNNLLHTLLGFYWIKIFGTRDAVIRSLSLFFGVLSCTMFFYWLAFLGFDGKSLFASALLFTLNPLIVVYVQEFRAYIQALFFTQAATFLLFLLLKKDRAHYYLFYALTAAASFLSHYATAYIFAAHALIFLLYARHYQTYFKMAGAVLLFFFFVALWMLQGGLDAMSTFETVNEIYRQRALHNTGDDNFALPATSANIVTGWFQMMLPMFSNGLQNTGLRIRHIAVLILIPLIFLLWAKKFFNHDKKMIVSLLILMLAAPVFATMSAVRAGHIISFQPHYAIFSIPYSMTLLLAGMLGTIQSVAKKRMKALYAALFLQGLIVLISLWPLFSKKNLKAPYNPYYAFVENMILVYQPGDTIVYASSEDAMYANVYLKKEKPVLQMIDSALTDGQVMIKRPGMRGEIIFDFSKKRF